MKETLEKIKTLLSIDNKEESKAVKMYAEMILDDGRVVATEDEQFMIGSEVFVVNDDGEASPLSAGSYTMDDGAKITVDDNGKILDLGEEKEAEDVENKKKEEYEEELADVGDWEGMEKRIQNLEDAVADLKREKVGGDDDVEEMSDEAEEVSDKPKSIKTTETVEFSAEEELEKLKAENEKLKTELAESPADAPINTNKFSAERTVLSKKEYNKLSRQERFLYNLNK